jgi:hypothetical protein
MRTGLDFLAFPCIFFRSNRLFNLSIAAGKPAKQAHRPKGAVRVVFFTYSKTDQEGCLG